MQSRAEDKIPISPPLLTLKTAIQCNHEICLVLTQSNASTVNGAESLKLSGKWVCLSLLTKKYFVQCFQSKKLLLLQNMSMIHRWVQHLNMSVFTFSHGKLGEAGRSTRHNTSWQHLRSKKQYKAPCIEIHTCSFHSKELCVIGKAICVVLSLAVSQEFSRWSQTHT